MKSVQQRCAIHSFQGDSSHYESDEELLGKDDGKLADDRKHLLRTQQCAPVQPNEFSQQQRIGHVTGMTAHALAAGRSYASWLSRS